jgi:hypothetical protein
MSGPPFAQVTWIWNGTSGGATEGESLMIRFRMVREPERPPPAQGDVEDRGVRHLLESGGGEIL